jgi:hypothetical protein
MWEISLSKIDALQCEEPVETEKWKAELVFQKAF